MLPWPLVGDNQLRRLFWECEASNGNQTEEGHGSGMVYDCDIQFVALHENTSGSQPRRNTVRFAVSLSVVAYLEEAPQNGLNYHVHKRVHLHGAEGLLWCMALQFIQSTRLSTNKLTTCNASWE